MNVGLEEEEGFTAVSNCSSNGVTRMFQMPKHPVQAISVKGESSGGI